MPDLTDEERAALRESIAANFGVNTKPDVKDEAQWRAAGRYYLTGSIELVRLYLQRDDQRAVSWHEIQDCLEALAKRIPKGD